MPTIEENYEFWNNRFLWAQHHGDVWSREWGGPSAQWDWCLYPRIRLLVPVETLLEIGSGQGRWTQYLRTCCERLIATDISDRCLKVCRERCGDEGIEYHLGDGKTLEFQEDSSVDLAFSFESLIHTELEDLTSYLQELYRVLKSQSRAFIHHSNLGNYPHFCNLMRKLPRTLKKFAQERGIIDFDGWRAQSVSAKLVKSRAEEVGFTVHSQELVPWGGKRLLDCFTILGKETVAQTQIYENHRFVERAREIRDLAGAYEG